MGYLTNMWHDGHRMDSMTLAIGFEVVVFGASRHRMKSEAT